MSGLVPFGGIMYFFKWRITFGIYQMPAYFLVQVLQFFDFTNNRDSPLLLAGITTKCCFKKTNEQCVSQLSLITEDWSYKTCRNTYLSRFRERGRSAWTLGMPLEEEGMVKLEWNYPVGYQPYTVTVEALSKAECSLLSCVWLVMIPRTLVLQARIL